MDYFEVLELISFLLMLDEWLRFDYRKLDIEDIFGNKLIFVFRVLFRDLFWYNEFVGVFMFVLIKVERFLVFLNLFVCNLV